MINITLGELIDAQPTLVKLSNAKMPIVASYKLAKIIEQVDDELQNFYSAREKAILNYCDKTEENTPVTDEHGNYLIKDEKKEELNKEIFELAAVEVELIGEQISISSIEGITISPMEIMTIRKLICE